MTIRFNNIYKTLCRCVVAMSWLLLLTGCQDTIYDPQGDCEIHHRLRFKFDYNLLYADAFPSQVHSVAVYAFKPDGTFAWKKEESGWHLSQDGYLMDLDDVEPGDYTLIGWCGMDNGFISNQKESFTLPQMVEGVHQHTDLINRMEREYESDGTAHSSADLWPLFHGQTADVKIFEQNGKDADGRTITYLMNLKKNTNKVRVILQQLSGEDINAEGFKYTIETANGLMAHHNGLIDDEPITYHPHKTGYGYGGIILDSKGRAEGTSSSVKVAVADLTVGRLIKDNPTTLTVYRPDGEVSAKIPLVDYALLTKGNYSTPMTDQEFLDREDTYTLTFFLDRNYKWAGASIYINSWRVVLTNQNQNL